MWMPFQSMGYPFLLNLQTGLFYPPMWAFPLLKIPYTLHAAVVFQGLHVLAGALGMYVLLRTLVRSRREALLGAFCFQLFGGFYSNAEHVDIVRAFAFTPWLLWAAAPPASGQRRLARRILLAPLFVFAMAVGGYPGNLVAALFLLAVFAVLVLLQRGFARPAWRWAAALGTSAALGLAMAAIHLGPAWIYRDELLRYHVASRLYRASLSAAHLPGLVLENRGMPVDVSMTSTFVGFAVLAGVCFLGRSSLSRLWPYAALGILSAAMAAGDTLSLHPLLRRLAPPLGYSRFPSSDYRSVFAVLLIALAAAGWRDLRRRGSKTPGLLLRLLPVALLAAWSIARVYAGEPFWPLPALAAASLAATAAALVFWTRSRRWPAIGVAAMLAAISLDGVRVLPRIQSWIVPDLIGTCRVFCPTPARMHDAGLIVDPALFRNGKPPRPGRTDGDGPYRASGYLSGAYALGDFGGPVLRARDAIVKDETYLAFMRREWLPVLVAAPAKPAVGAIDVPVLAARVRAAAPDPRVVQTDYGIDRVRYRVSIESELLLVENEIFFPGWSAVREGGDRSPTRAVRVNGLFRGWLLPAGRYTLEARFRVPGLRLLAAATAAAWAAWLLWVAAVMRPRARET
jgi:hypothetical protein